MNKTILNCLLDLRNPPADPPHVGTDEWPESKLFELMIVHGGADESVELTCYAFLQRFENAVPPGEKLFWTSRPTIVRHPDPGNNGVVISCKFFACNRRS